jgi:hypothetical protein
MDGFVQCTSSKTYIWSYTAFETVPRSRKRRWNACCGIVTQRGMGGMKLHTFLRASRHDPRVREKIQMKRSPSSNLWPTRWQRKREEKQCDYAKANRVCKRVALVFKYSRNSPLPLSLCIVSYEWITNMFSKRSSIICQRTPSKLLVFAPKILRFFFPTFTLANMFWYSEKFPQVERLCHSCITHPWSD